MSTWHGDAPAAARPAGMVGRIRIALRMALIAGIILLGLVFLVPLRLIERPFHGLARPWSGRLVQAVFRCALPCMGLRLVRRGIAMHHRGAIVANHASWLDIIVLGAAAPVQFVSKAEVAAWPGIGFLAKIAGTLFIRREARDARAQQTAMEDRIRAGQRLVFFPEGTSSDGRRVLPFKSTLFQAFFTENLNKKMWLQPVTVIYTAPVGEDLRFYGWWGSTGFGPHLLQVLAAPCGRVDAVFHPPLRVADFSTRKEMALACEAAVRGAMDQALSR